MNLTYRISTLLLVLQAAATACVFILRPPMVAQIIHHLGYPAYFPLLLGVAKILAVIALVQPWSATLKEWAYAGLTFDAIAALCAHLAAHDSTADVVGPLVILMLIGLSYVTRGRVRASRGNVTLRGAALPASSA